MEYSKIIWVEESVSTNTELADLARAGDVVQGTVLSAVKQTGGRGRYDRKWIAPAGKNLTFSIFFISTAGFPAIASLPMAVSIGVKEYLSSIGIDARCKWPNDLMIGDAKICGILSERFSSEGAGNIDNIILGVGLNMNMTAEDVVGIDKPAVSACIIGGKTYDLRDELKNLLGFITPWINKWEQGGFSVIRERWLEVCWKIGEEVMIGDGADRCCGMLYDFGKNGEAIVKLADDTLKTVWSGDVESRK